MQVDRQAPPIFAHNAIGHDDVATPHIWMKSAGESRGHHPLRPMSFDEGGGCSGGILATDAAVDDYDTAAVPSALPHRPFAAADRNQSCQPLFDRSRLQRHREHEAYMARRQVCLRGIIR